jgi:hypothetical protein
MSLLFSSSYFLPLSVLTNKRSVHHVLVTLVGRRAPLNKAIPPYSSNLRTINHRRAYSLPSMQQRKPLTWVVLNHLSSIKRPGSKFGPYHTHQPLTAHSQDPVARPHNPSSTSTYKKPTTSTPHQLNYSSAVTPLCTDPLFTF